MTSPADGFIARSRDAIDNAVLQSALKKARPGFINKRLQAVDKVPNFEELRSKAQEVRQHSLRNLPVLLSIFEARVLAAGGHIHWVESTEELRKTVLDIAIKADAKTVSKGKSMIGEEAELNKYLEENGIQPIETDLGEYILQLADEAPSHIVAPALHKTRKQIADLFIKDHPLGDRELETVQDIVDEARQVIRTHFIEADIGITGANILIADTGTSVLCTNEGNGDLTASLPNTHIITTSFDKVVANWDDASAILRVLARSATGQAITTYTTFYGPKQPEDLDGPENFHIVLLNNQRSKLLGSEFQEMLQCIKCGACMNHCPVYQAVGGHSYDSVYPGPMGSVLTPLLRGKPEDYALADSSTFCGRCEEVCPVKIPLPSLLRKLRIQKHETLGNSKSGRFISVFSWFSQHPVLYRRLTTLITLCGKFLSFKQGRWKKLPGLKSWTQYRDMPAPQGKTFQQQWYEAGKKSHEQ